MTCLCSLWKVPGCQRAQTQAVTRLCADNFYRRCSLTPAPHTRHLTLSLPPPRPIDSQRHTPLLTAKFVSTGSWMRRSSASCHVSLRYQEKSLGSGNHWSGKLDFLNMKKTDSICHRCCFGEHLLGCSVTWFTHSYKVHAALRTFQHGFELGTFRPALPWATDAFVAFVRPVASLPVDEYFITSVPSTSVHKQLPNRLMFCICAPSSRASNCCERRVAVVLSFFGLI